MTLTVLIADDDHDVSTVVAYGARMTWPDCRVLVAANGTAALELFAEEQPDLVVLDVSMPAPDGFEVCRQIRETSGVPILMLTVRGSTLDKVRALDRGADDYLTKPFDEVELLARLRALVRRAQGAYGLRRPRLTVGEVALDPQTHEVWVRGEPVRLTATEYRLLEVLLRHAGTALPHDYLVSQVWGAAYVGDAQSLRTFVRRLRRKLGDDPAQPRYIQTDWHTGYRFVPTP